PNMAYANTRTAGTSLAERFGTMMSRISDYKAKRRVYHTTLRELDMLSKRELNDLGINRSDIQSIALEAAYGK
ncbi:MAG: DUF1127 domain-containing protein, partial [Paracoccaceae bacterium]